MKKVISLLLSLIMVLGTVTFAIPAFNIIRVAAEDINCALGASYTVVRNSNMDPSYRNDLQNDASGDWLTDGKVGTGISAGTDYYTVSYAGTDAVYVVTLTLDAVYNNIEYILLENVPDPSVYNSFYNPIDVSISVSTDGVSYSPVTFTENPVVEVYGNLDITYTFDSPVSASYVKFSWVNERYLCGMDEIIISGSNVSVAEPEGSSDETSEESVSEPSEDSSVDSSADSSEDSTSQPSGNLWGDLSWVLDDEGTLTVSGTGAMDDFSYGSTDAWLAYRDSIKSVVITEGVTSVSANAFRDCYSLVRVTLPEGLESIGAWAFDCCWAMTAVTAPASLATVGTNAFRDCSSLARVSYSGTKEQWKAISVNSGNAEFLNAYVGGSGSIQGNSNVALNANYSVTDADGGAISYQGSCTDDSLMFLTDGAFRGDDTNEFNGDLGVAGVTVEMPGTLKDWHYVIDITDTYVHQVVIINGRRASNRYTNLAGIEVLVDGEWVAVEFTQESSPVEGAPSRAVDDINYDQYYNITANFTPVYTTQIKVIVNTDYPDGAEANGTISATDYGRCYITQLDEIQVYGGNIEEDSSEESSEEPSSEPEAEAPTYTATFTDYGNGTGTIKITLPAGDANLNGKVVLAVSDNLTYVEGSLSNGISGGYSNATYNADGYSGLMCNFMSADSVAEGSVLLSASFSIAQGVTVSVDDFAVVYWKLGDAYGTDYDTGDVIEKISEISGYLVKFMVDGVVISTQEVKEGGAATAPTDPVKEGYTFTGWDKAFDSITEDTTVTAIFEIKTYSVSFVVDGVTVDEQTVNHGEAAVAPADPEKEGCTFTGWDKAFDSITEDTTVTAVFEIKTYSVSFVVDGVTVDEQTVNHSEAAIAPAAPEKEGYTFTGWDKAFDKVTEDITVNATFEIKTYSVSFVVDGVTVDTQTVNHGEAAIAPADPEKEGSTFTGWDKAFDKVTEDMEITALWDLKTYSVSFVVDGETVDTQTVAHGGAATAPADPAKEGYTFTGWDKAFDMVTEDIAVNATFEIKTYSVSFVADGAVVDTQTVAHGGAATAPADPAKEGYTFTGWDKAFDSITEDITVTAIWTVKSFMVVFAVEGVIVKVETLEYGASATPPTDPVKEGYVFAGWDRDYDFIKADVVINAVFEEEKPTEFFVFTDTADTTVIAKHEDEGLLTLSAGGISIDELKARFEDELITVYTATGAVKSSGTVGTGCVIASTIGEETRTLTVVVYGDINGDGGITASDYAQVLAHSKGNITLTGVKFAAANVAQVTAATITAADYSMILTYAKGNITKFNVKRG